jgi:glucose/arabinose dehydrogenase
MRALALLVAACADSRGTNPPPPPPPGPGGVALQRIPGAFSQPLYVTAPPGDMARIFVVEKTGRIRIVRNDTLLARAFLNLSASVSGGGEQGLLGLAFHPGYATNGRFYVSYTNTAGDTRIVRYRVSSDPDSADRATADTILSQDQPFANHNGGWIGFGPDRYLYVALGDGGDAGDPQGNGQSLATLLGKVLRLDVNGATGYTVPADNPFVSVAGLDEIWASGLRNPWRSSFDRQTGDFYIADVGQGAWEELSVQPASSIGGENYGWDVMEGAHCFGVATCNQTGKVRPIYEYDRRGPGQGCSITGGYVYRGSRVPALAGRYVFADFCAGFVRSLRYVGGRAEDLRDHTDSLAAPPEPSSFGEDARGELYLTSLQGGVYRFVAAN